MERWRLGPPLYIPWLSRIPHLPHSLSGIVTHGSRQGHNSPGITVRVSKVLREQKGYRRQNYSNFNPATNDALELFVAGVIWAIPRDRPIWKVTFGSDGRLLQRSSVNYFTAFGGNNELYWFPNIDIEARLPYICMEAKDSQHILKDCKKTGKVEIILFTLITSKSFNSCLCCGSTLAVLIVCFTWV